MYPELVIALKKRRVRCGLTIKMLAEKSGINYRALREIEALKRDMKLGEYKAVIRALGVTDLDISLDMMDIADINDREAAAIMRLLSAEGRKLLVDFIATEYKKPVN